MFRSLAAILAALVLAPVATLAQTPAPEPVQVMVIAAPHLDNPGRDVHNAHIDPVTTPQKQAELARIAEDLARFRPTAVAIERVAPDQATLIDPVFAEYRPDWLPTRPDERIQIGVNGSQVTLHGLVHSWAESRAVEKAAWSVPGVASVANDLIVLD